MIKGAEDKQMKEELYANDMFIEYEEIDILLKKLFDKSEDIEGRIIFDDNEREAVEYKQQIVNGRGKKYLDKIFIIYMDKENVQQTDVSGVQLKTNGKKEFERLWKMKLDEKRDTKKEKLTIGICISKNRGKKQIKIWKYGGTKVIVAEELNQQHNESDDQLQSKVWDTGWIAEETHAQEVMETFNFESLMQEHSGQSAM